MPVVTQSTENRVKRQKLGLCTYCYSPATEGKKMCLRHLAQCNKRVKADTDWKKAQKYCARGGCWEITIKGIYCEVHRLQRLKT